MRPEKVINDGIVKTVAAFLNSHGGTLAIGITDDGDIFGIQHDLDFKHQDLDGYQNWLSGSARRESAPERSAPMSVSASNRWVPRSSCSSTWRRRRRPLRQDHQRRPCFYVRVNNTTRQFEGRTSRATSTGTGNTLSGW